MWKNYLLTGVRNLGKQKGYTLINIAGLAVAVASCLLIFLYIRLEYSFDQHLPNADRVYRIGESRPDDRELFSFWTRGQLIPALHDVPGVESGTRIQETTQWVARGDLRTSEHTLFVDTTFFEVFPYTFIKGQPQKAFPFPNAVIITESLARKFFNQTDVLGHVLQIQFEDHVVTGVVEDIPETSSIRGDLLLPVHPVEENWGMNWENTNTPSYVLLEEGSNPERIAFQAGKLVSQHVPDEQISDHAFILLSLLQYHIAVDDGNWSPGISSRQLTLSILFAIAVLIALIASINFANLATARSLSRNREIGVRKVLGAHRIQLIIQFLGEALLMGIGAMCLGAGVAELVLPTFNALLITTLDLDFVADPKALLILFGIGLGVTLLAGTYPAVYLTHFTPGQTLHGRLHHSRRGAAIRNGLVVIQFAFSVMLIIGTLVIWQQISFMKNQDLNFDAEGVVVVSISPGQFQDRKAGAAQIDIMKQELLRHNRIVGLSSSVSVPGEYSQWGFTFTLEGLDKTVHSRWTNVDRDYFSVYGINLAEGRIFSRESDKGNTAVINQAAAKAFGWEDPVGKSISWDGNNPAEIIGVVEDFNYESLDKQIYPMVHFYSGQSPDAYWMLSIKISAGAVEPVLDFIREQLHTIDPSREFEITFADQNFEKLYQEVERRGILVGSFATIAIVIACLGLLGLAAYSATQRTKEIGIRKAMGATVPAIVFLLTRQFARLILLSFLFAVPVTYLLMNNWLEDFAYRIALSWWVFTLAGIAVLGMAFLTISYQAFRAATADPVKALRYE